ncbi:MAG: S9 family peptidase, partial [Alphaproteobacteria bacterium]|nr:S9 family peptidase [Alphaproteobacteria bacterium]
EDKFVALYAIPIDGGESRRVYTHGADIEGFEVSPDGRHIAFLATDAAPERQDDLEGKGFKAVVYAESARPTRVWLLDLLNEVPQARSAELDGSATELHWAPDGGRYVVALAPTPSIDDFYVSRRLHVVDALEGRVLNRIENVGKLGALAWSPDGARVAYVGAEDINDPLEGRVFLAAADGEGITNLTPDYPGHVAGIAWRDADTIWYRGARGVWTEIGSLDVSGLSVTATPPAGGPIVRAFDAAPGSAVMAVIADTPEHPREVYAWSEADGYRRLTNSNPALGNRSLARQEVVRYVARDGLEIEGILLRPLQSRRGQRHPLILVAHGGPEAHYSNGWISGYSVPAHAMAASGYALYYPNYRASTGRGVEFSKLDHGDPAGREFDDLVDAKEHLVSTGLVDPARVGITGGSYGGFATMWGATALTEHFAAAVAFVGIANLASKVVSGDIPNELYLVHLRRWPWEDWSFALQRSPVYHADKARTPLLILVGANDTRVNPSQSLELYEHIKLRTDTPVRLVRYPGEGHGNRNTAAQLDYALRMTRWMDHYLMGPGGAPPPHELPHAERLAGAEAADGEE